MFVSERRRRPWVRPVLIGVLVVLAGAALAAYAVLENRNDDVQHGDQVEFRAPPPPPRAEAHGRLAVLHCDAAHRGFRRRGVSPPYNDGRCSAARC